MPGFDPRKGVPDDFNYKNLGDQFALDGKPFDSDFNYKSLDDQFAFDGKPQFGSSFNYKDLDDQRAFDEARNSCLENGDCAIGFICADGQCIKDEGDGCGQPGCGGPGSEGPQECFGIEVVRPGGGGGISRVSCGTRDQETTVECLPFPITKCSRYCDDYYDLYGEHAGGCNDGSTCNECDICDELSGTCIPNSTNCNCPEAKSPDGVEGGGPCYECDKESGLWNYNGKKCQTCGRASIPTDCGCTKELKTFTREICSTELPIPDLGAILAGQARQLVEADIAEYCSEPAENCFVRGLGNYIPNQQGNFDGPPPTLGLFDITGWGPPSNGLPGYADAWGTDYNSDDGCPQCFTIPGVGKKSLPPMYLNYSEADLDPAGVGLENLTDLCPGDALCIQVGESQIGDYRGVMIAVYPTTAQQNQTDPNGNEREIPPCDDPSVVGRWAHVYEDRTPSFTYQLCDCRGGQALETQPSNTRYIVSSRFDAQPVTREVDPIINDDFPCAGVPNGNNAALMNTRCSSYTKLVSGEVVYLLLGDVCGPGKPNPSSGFIVKDGEGNTIVSTNYGVLGYPYQDAVINFNRDGVNWTNGYLKPEEMLVTDPVNPAYLPPTCLPLPKLVAVGDFQAGTCTGRESACEALMEQYFGQLSYLEGERFPETSCGAS